MTNAAILAITIADEMKNTHKIANGTLIAMNNS